MVLWTGISFTAMLVVAIILSATLEPLTVREDFNRPDQCERLRAESSVMEPQNAWSNLGYLLGGLLILFRNIRTDRVFGFSFGVAMVALAWFSGLYHAQPVSDFLRHLDVATIYWVLPILIAYALHGAFVYKVSGVSWPTRHVLYTVGFLVVLGTSLAFAGGIDSTILTMVLVSILVGLTAYVMFFKKLVTPLRDTEKAAYTTLLLVLLLGSGVTRLFDGQGEFFGIEKFLCIPDGAIQAHASWHVLSALTLLLGYNLLSRTFSDDGTVFPAEPWS
jgi:hypothetical protein